jgi:hypothetical protein
MQAAVGLRLLVKKVPWRLRYALQLTSHAWAVRGLGLLEIYPTYTPAVDRPLFGSHGLPLLVPAHWELCSSSGIDVYQFNAQEHGEVPLCAFPQGFRAPYFEVVSN